MTSQNRSSGHDSPWRCPACLARTAGAVLVLVLAVVGAVTAVRAVL